MTKSEIAISGPRSLRNPRSHEYAIQTMRSLKRYLESKSLDARGVEDELQRIVQHRHWEICGFKTLDAYLKAEVGTTLTQLKHRLAQDLAADPNVTAAAPEGTAGPGRGHKSVDIVHGLSRLNSNSAERIVRRLKRDHPKIAESLGRGEFKSARAAGIAAGIITVPTALEKILALLPKLTPTERQQLQARLACEAS
jgi:hypothetical protein